MNHSTRTLFVLLAAVLTLSSCQKTNISDLITFHRIPEDKLQDYSKTVRLESSRAAAVLDSLDNTGEQITLPKGTKVTILGLRSSIGGFKTTPIIFDRKFKGYDLWLGELSDGRRVYLQATEMYYDREPLKTNEIAIYFPHRHHMPFLTEEDKDNLDTGWKKALIGVGKVYDFATEHTLSSCLYKDGSFYRYTPLIKNMPQWLKRGVQALLSFLLLGLLFMIVVPWLALNSVWHFRFIPNWLVKVLGTILCYVYAFFIGSFLGLTPWGFILWALMLVSRYFSSLTDDVNWERCPYCHKLAISYEGTEYGNWKHTRREWDKEETKSVEQIEHDESDGLQTKRVKKTIYHQGIKHYVGLSKSRSVTESHICPHCKREIKYYSTESDYRESSEWK